MLYANNKGADQPAHLHSLIRAFVVRCLDSIISLVSISKISSLYLASVAAQASLYLTWSQTPKTGFLMTRLKLLMILPVRALLMFCSIVQEHAVVTNKEGTVTLEPGSEARNIMLNGQKLENEVQLNHNDR